MAQTGKKPGKKQGLRLEYLSPAELEGNPENWRVHPEAQVAALGDVIDSVGWAGACLYNKRTGRLIDGHARKQIALQKGEQKIPVLVGDWSEEDERLILATLDPIAAMANSNAKALESLISEISSQSVPINQMLEQLLIQSKAIEAEMKPTAGGGGDDFDPTPAPAEEPTETIAGSIYLIGGKHRLLVGDSTSAPDVLRLMAGKQANLLLTDPPYNVAYEGKTKDRLEIKNDQMVDGDFQKFLTAAFVAADAVLAPGASFYIWHADSEGFNFRLATINAGWQVRQCLVWVKNTMVLGRQDYQWKHEPCLYGWKEGAAHTWLSDRKQTTVLNFDKPSRSADHPTTKPIDLFTYQIQNSCPAGGIVLDLFLGSGTSLVAAHRTNRICYGCELDPHYADVILNRARAEGLSVELVS